MPLARAAEAIEEIRRGKAVIVVDDQGNEAQGNFVVAAEKITPDWVNFMAKRGRGLVYLTLTEARAHELDRFCQRYGIHLMPLSTDDDPVSALQKALGRRTH